MVARPKSEHALGARFKDGGFFDTKVELFAGQDLPGVYVGFDQSYTGFGATALRVDDNTYFTWCYTSKQKHEVLRLLEIEQFVSDLLRHLTYHYLPASQVSMEGYANAATFGREKSGELGYAVKRTLWCDRREVPLVVPPTSLKKYATGKGNAKKNEILMAVYKHWGVEFTDDNMADSFVLAYIASGFSKYAYQAEVLAKLKGES